MSIPTFWLVIGLAAAGTFAMRAVPFFAHGRVEMPETLTALLRYVPAASLAALVVPGSLLVGSGGVYTVELPRVLALIVAVAVAVRWRNMVLTIVVGMGALWLLQWAL